MTKTGLLPSGRPARVGEGGCGSTVAVCTSYRLPSYRACFLCFIFHFLSLLTSSQSFPKRQSGISEQRPRMCLKCPQMSCRGPGGRATTMLPACALGPQGPQGPQLGRPRPSSHFHFLIIRRTWDRIIFEAARAACVSHVFLDTCVCSF